MKFNSNLANLPVYEAGKPIELVVREFGVKDVVKLASNENPFGPSPSALKAIKKAAKVANLYPDDSYYELKDALGAKFGLKSENFIIGSGSDEIIEFIISAKTNSKTAILQAGVTFAMYEIYAARTGAKVYKTTSQTHNLKELKELYLEHQKEIKVIFLCLPNNPLGECLNSRDVEDFMKIISPDAIVALDCAYMEFASAKSKAKLIDPKKILAKLDNAIYLGTFSKAYGLGGMRVGYGIGEVNLIKELHKMRSPFNISSPSLAGAIAALNDDKFIKKTTSNNFEQMKIFEKFAKDKGLKFIPSYANFITILLNSQDSTKICDNLLKRGIILRNLKSYGLNAIRITIGKPKQNRKVIDELEKEI